MRNVILTAASIIIRFGEISMNEVEADGLL